MSMAKISRYLNDNGPLVLVLELVKRLGARLRGRLYRRIFSAVSGEIGTGAYIRGLGAIRIGPGFRCGKLLWLEALREYRGVKYEPRIELGRGVSLSNNVHISCINLVRLGNDVLVGSNVYIGDHGHGNYGTDAPSSPDAPPADRILHSPGPVVIGDHVWIGDGVVVCGGVTIGSGAVIGANSVVTKDIPPGVIAAGVPARPVKRYAATGWVKLSLEKSEEHE